MTRYKVTDGIDKAIKCFGDPTHDLQITENVFACATCGYKLTYSEKP